MNLGNSTGAVKVNFNPASIPDKCSWTYDSVTRSEYSSATEGYLQGVIGTVSSGNSCSGLALTNANGINGQATRGATYSYDASSNDFVIKGITETVGHY